MNFHNTVVLETTLHATGSVTRTAELLTEFLKTEYNNIAQAHFKRYQQATRRGDQRNG